MKVTTVESFLVSPRWVFVRVTTDDGVVGWGEATLEGRAEPIVATLEIFAEYLVGRDPRRINEHWQVLARGGFYRGGPILSSALAGVDQALWDILGKSLGVPVHQLLGGPVRERIRVYTSIGGESIGELVAEALARVADGYTALKIAPASPLRLIDTPAASAAIGERLTAVRAAVGPECDVAVDLHGRCTLAMAKRTLPLLEPSLPLFVEESTVPEVSDLIRELTSSTSVPIALGERLYSRWDFRRVIDKGVAVVQPDVSHAGGISEVVKIAALAEAYDVAVAPHCPLGPIAFAASLQVASVVPNLLIQEQSLALHLGRASPLLSTLVDPTVLALTDGFVARPDGPGLGIDVDERAVRAAATEPHRWRPPYWHRDDGSLAEW